MKTINAILLSSFLLPMGLSALTVEKLDPVGTVSVAIDATKPGAVLPNTSQVLTFWNGVMTGDRSPVAWPKEPRQDYPIGFARYAELMACTGGNKSRDLFKNPDDRTVLDDYDFAPLVAACRGILGCGMKPYLKLGNVPPKFSSDYDGGEFSMNIRPPTDDLVHYRYMKACAAALKSAFGRDEVRSWRFAVLTEADNTGWFQAKSKLKADSRAAFFRLYDYAARAFEEELGPDLVFGTHMLYPGDPHCPQTQFSVEEVVAHCVNGTNAATGKIGAPLRLLTASYYGRPDRDDLSQGRCTNLRRIRTALDKAGLTDVVTGVDEGRVIVATPGREKKDLLSRAVGASYEAAFDVRVIKEIFDDRMDYFATWGYFSGPRVHFEGIPSHHYFSSRELAKFEGFKRAPTHVSGKMPPKEEMDAIAGVSADGRTVRAVVARFRDKLVFTNRIETTVTFQLPKVWAGRCVRVGVLTLDDRNNWFVDWERDRVARGITAKDYDWSWDDFAVLAHKNLQGKRYREIFTEELQPRYAKKATSVRPTESTETVSADATLTLPVSFVGNGAAFLSVEAVAKQAEVNGHSFVASGRIRQRPFAILRSYGSYSNNVRFTERVFAAQERHPGLFNEIWFGGNDGGLDNTPEVRGKLSAEKNLGVRDRCHKLGIAFSYQQGVTLNHGSDGIRRPHIPENAWAVNREGKKAYGLLCCTSPWTRDYLRATAREIMSRLQPDSYWPDDDMRLLKGDWHAAYLCFCDRCVKLFGESYGEAFTRESLVKALNGPDGSAAVRRAWSAFNGRNLGECAKVYREAADAVSPKTQLGIQIALSGNTVDGDSWKTMVEALAGPNGKAGTRPGGLYYTDFKPRDLPAKMILVAREAARSGALPQIGQICYEDENWPHVGGHKNAHAMMAECAWALAAGCDSIAFYWGADQNGEDAASHDFWLEAVWAWRPFHLAVRDAFAGTRLGGVAAFHGANHWATKGWANHDEDELPALVACGVPVTVTEASPDALWLNERCVETLAEGDFTNVFSRPVLMSAAAYDALAKRFPKLGFPKKVAFSFREGEKALATGKRTNGYELFPSGLRSENVKAFVRPKSADVKAFSSMTEEPGACGTCVVPTEFGGRVVIAQEVPAHWPHGVWPGSRRHAILDALDFATPGGAPARLLTDGYSVAISVRKTPDGRTAGVFLFNLGLGETPPLELVLRRGVSEDWTVSQPRRSSVAAEVVRRSSGETVIRIPPMGAYEPLLVRSARQL